MIWLDPHPVPSSTAATGSHANREDENAPSEFVRERLSSVATLKGAKTRIPCPNSALAPFTFLPPVTEDVPLNLIETRTFGSRVIYERYGRARDESD